MRNPFSIKATSQRVFFKALQELRLIEKRAKAVRETAIKAELGSILPTGLSDLSDADFEEAYAKAMERASLSPFERLVPDNFATSRGRVDVPISIGKRR